MAHTRREQMDELQLDLNNSRHHLCNTLWEKVLVVIVSAFSVTIKWVFLAYVKREPRVLVDVWAVLLVFHNKMVKQTQH